MPTDSEIKVKGYNILRREFGDVDAEKFISLIIKDPFDYTLWRKELFKDKDFEQISKEAMNLKQE